MAACLRLSCFCCPPDVVKGAVPRHVTLTTSLSEYSAAVYDEATRLQGPNVAAVHRIVRNLYNPSARVEGLLQTFGPGSPDFHGYGDGVT